MTVQFLVFYTFSALLLGAGVMVITSRNPVRAVLFLVLAFVASAVLWMLMQSEFLSLVLIFVYVGAVMTLFLFVVMMLDIDKLPEREGFVKYLPFGLVMMAVLVGLMLMVIDPSHFKSLGQAHLINRSADYSNVKELGLVLYTTYMYPFELAAVLLLVAIVSAISLAFRGRQGSKSQKISAQLKANKADRLQLHNLKSEES